MYMQVRAIPIELQRLFSRLLLLDQASATVTALTDSFGWTSNEVSWESCKSEFSNFWLGMEGGCDGAPMKH